MRKKNVLVLLILSFAFAATSVAQERVLHFPTDQSLGMLTRAADADELDGWRSVYGFWGMGPHLGEAQGEVLVPADVPVGLVVISGREFPALSPFADLAPGQIDALHIEARGVKPGDACLLPVTRMVGLSTLTINKTGITPSQWDMVANMASLERLSVFDDLDESDAAQVARMKSLRSLRFHSSRPLSPETISSLATLPLLEELSVSRLEPAAYARLKELGSVKMLWLGNSDDGVENLQELARMPSLIHLEIELTDAGLAALPEMPRLKFLEIRGRGYAYTVAGFAPLSRFRRLEAFCVVGTLDDDAVTAIEPLPELKQFVHIVPLPRSGARWPNIEPSDMSLAHLARFKSLEYVDLRAGSFSEEGLQHLCALPNLKGLTMPNNLALTDAGMAEIGKCEGLEYLNVRAANITDAGLAHLEGLSQLQTLVLFVRHESKITDEAVALLNEKLPGLTVASR